jgi:hypothetical protein
MTRRLTFSGTRSEMGMLEESPVTPESPPPSWSPAKYDIWKKPSRWQLCMPRLRLVAKIVGSFFALIILLKILSAAPPPTPPPEPPAEVAKPVVEEVVVEVTPVTEDDLMKQSEENAKKENWIWKDFPTYVTSCTQPRLVLDRKLTFADMMV